MNDPDFNDPEISDNLRRIVPDDLSSDSLVDGARRKRRRRNGLVGAVAAVALVGLAVPVALNLPTNDITAQPANTPAGQHSGDPAAASALPGAQACYNDDGTPISWEQDESGPAEPGAVKAWLCGDYSPETGLGFVGPLEPLTSGLDTLVSDVQAADEVDLAVTTCPDMYNLSFNVVFEYEDGTRHVIGGDRHGCRTTYDGGVVREGSEEFYGALITAWGTQRETDTGDWMVPNICPGPLSLIPMEFGDAVQGSVCAENRDGVDERSAAYLSDELVQEVVGSIESELVKSVPETPRPTSTATEEQYWLTLSNKFTDYLTFIRHGDGAFRAYDGDGLAWFWKPSEDLSSRLDEELANAGSGAPPAGKYSEPPTVTIDPGPTPDPEEPTDVPQPFVPAECHAASDGVTSTVLPDGELPQGAERIWLCPAGDYVSGIATPLEPLDEPDLVAQAAEAFNNLAPMLGDQPCGDDLGPTYQVVHEYADGTRYTIEYQQYGCRPAKAGDVVKESGLYLGTLVDLWGQQRTDRTTTQTRPGPLCQLFSSVFTIDPTEATFTSGTACIDQDSDSGAGEAALEEPIATELLSVVTGELANSTPVGTFAVGDDGNRMVLLTGAGDPFMLSRLKDGTFYWSEDDGMRLWEPTGEVAEALDALFAK